ncbi:AraC family transcriptional regulator [Vallitalea sediminicola]
MNDIKKEFFLRKLSKEEKTIQDKTIYNILPEYGNGTIIMYKIIEGMYLNYSDFKFKDIIKNDIKSNYCDNIISIEYCIDGEWKCNFKNDKVAFAQKGNSAYGAGKSCFLDLDYKGKTYKSINIFCYLNEITNSVEKIFGVSKEKINKYYDKLSRRKDFLIIKFDDEAICILNEIYKYIKCDNVELIKLRAIELLLLEINNYEDYKNKKGKYYTKSLVEKVERIHNIIDENYNKNFTIEDLAKKEKISATSLKTCFKDLCGDTIYSYKKKCRMQKARELLLETDYRVYEIALIVGYREVAMFIKAFKKTYNMTPTEYRKIKVKYSSSYLVNL